MNDQTPNTISTTATFFDLGVYKKMVVLTIVAPSSKHTVYFDAPIPKTRFVSLLSCSLYNSWNTLKAGGYMTYKIGDKTFYADILNAGNYNFETLATSMGLLIEANGGVDSFTLDDNLANLFDLKRSRNIPLQ